MPAFKFHQRILFVFERGLEARAYVLTTMKISYNWLKEFVDIPEAPKDLGTRFTNIGLAVDALESQGGESVFELDVASNRPDCLSHFGVAREVGVVYDLPLKPRQFGLREDEKR